MIALGGLSQRHLRCSYAEMPQPDLCFSAPMDTLKGLIASVCHIRRHLKVSSADRYGCMLIKVVCTCTRTAQLPRPGPK